MISYFDAVEWMAMSAPCVGRLRDVPATLVDVAAFLHHVEDNESQCKEDESKGYVCARMAAEAAHHVSNGSEWTWRDCTIGEDHEFSVQDQGRVQEALLDLARELDRRGRGG